MRLFGKTTGWLRAAAIVAVAVGLVAAGWTVWKKLATDSVVVDSYKACVDAGNPIMLSYPSVCMTKEGQRFVNPEHQPVE